MNTKKTPVIVLAVLTLVLTASVVYAFNVALTIPATVNVVEPATYWTSTTSTIELGDVVKGTTSELQDVRIYNEGTTAQVLHVSATGLAAGFTLVVKTAADATYVDTSVAAGGYIDLKIGVAVGGSVGIGLEAFNVQFTTV